MEPITQFAGHSLGIRLTRLVTGRMARVNHRPQLPWPKTANEPRALITNFNIPGFRSIWQSSLRSRAFYTSAPGFQTLGKIELKRMPIITHDTPSTPGSTIYDQTHDFNTESGSAQSRPTIWKPFVFCFGLSLLGFGTALHLTNTDTTSKIDYVLKNYATFPHWLSRMFISNPDYVEPSDAQLQQLRKFQKLEFIKSSGLNRVLPNHMLTWYINLGEGKQICLILVLANLPIFLMWQLPRWTKFMTTHFAHDALSGKSHTLLTSTFSHASALHLGFNMMALYSIGSTAHDSLTHRFRASRDHDPVVIPESRPTYHFLAFYLFAGLLAGFGSHAFSLMIRAPRLLKWRQSTSNPNIVPAPILPSLGASGAIYGCLTMTALAFPDAHVSLIFLPWVPLKIGGAVMGAVLFDLVGLIRNWKFFDHAAHLSGALAGVLWHLVIAKWFDKARAKTWSKVNEDGRS